MKNILIVVAIVVLAGVGYFMFVKKDSQIAEQPTPTPAPTKTVQVSKSPTPTPVQSSEVLTLTSPKSGATYNKGGEIRITGKTKPNYYIQVYANYPPKDLQCLTFNSMSNGGAGQADASGNFDFVINYLGYKSGQNTLVVAALPDSRMESCFPANNLSDVITYTYTGTVPNP